MVLVFGSPACNKSPKKQSQTKQATQTRAKTFFNLTMETARARLAKKFNQADGSFVRKVDLST
ncbi:hypothetical protein SAMN05444287_0912 [Octadecabacter temperatus]|uniref:Uncharacterized protein n=1 Tax=Octadecabacter temperatus TaxID=1458307 RepID=A0A0K0Y4A1_9RHOB|nr:hypothetical protein OSB_12580 [Octadecabacter temperatus]SIO01106.1 hypothetical protein SAMN05444287_0912 [Octadecabacter temperatus]